MPILTEEQFAEFRKVVVTASTDSDSADYRIQKANQKNGDGGGEDQTRLLEDRYYSPFEGREYFSRAPGKNPPVGYKEPQFREMSFFYFKIKPNGKVIVRYYNESHTHVLDIDNMHDFVIDKIEDARSEDPEVKSGLPRDIKWERPGFLGFFLDNQEWKLEDWKYPDIPGSRSLSFHINDIESETTEHAPSGMNLDDTRNWSFLRSKRHHLEGGAHYLIVENHHNRSHEPYVPRKKKEPVNDSYKFDLIYFAKIENKLGSSDGASASGKDKLLMIVDPGGRNTGP